MLIRCLEQVDLMFPKETGEFVGHPVAVFEGQLYDVPKSVTARVPRVPFSFATPRWENVDPIKAGYVKKISLSDLPNTIRHVTRLPDRGRVDLREPRGGVTAVKVVSQ